MGIQDQNRIAVVDKLADDAPGRYGLVAARHRKDCKMTGDHLRRGECDLDILARDQAADPDAALILGFADKKLAYRLCRRMIDRGG